MDQNILKKKTKKPKKIESLCLSWLEQRGSPNHRSDPSRVPEEGSQLSKLVPVC